MPEDLLIVVPVFNAEMHLQEFCDELQSYAQADILFIDDGSTDDTQNVLKQIGINYLAHDQNLGKGRALRTGMNYAAKFNYRYTEICSIHLSRFRSLSKSHQQM